MSFHKLDIREGKLFLGDVVLGSVTTNPPGELNASAQTFEGENILKVRIHWQADQCDELSAPLEILKVQVDDLHPTAAFIAGRKYCLSHASPVPSRKLRFPYNTYYKFRISAGGPYDAALYGKMPLACWQSKDRAFAIVFPKFLRVGERTLPVFTKASGTDAPVDFSAAIPGEFMVKRKPFGWFSTRVERETHTFALTQGQSFEAEFLLVLADTWVECVRACVKHLYVAAQNSRQISADTLAELLDKSIHFYNRVWDEHNRTHMHLPLKNVPGFESVEFKHSHVTDDITKLVLYRRLINMGSVGLAEREKKLLGKLSAGAYCYEMNGSQLWHTTTYFNGKDLRPFTHHGIGFVGFPGGMATVVRRLFEYSSLGAANNELENLAASGADWLLRVQRQDGSWPAALEERRSQICCGCVASTAEAARALMAAYRRTEKREYREAVEGAMCFINREESYFECRQYLRDVDPAEVDGITAEACIHANLDWFSLAGDNQAMEQARKWGFYALQWVRPDSPEARVGLSFDGLSQTITPRVDLWGELLIARAFMKLSRLSGDEMWCGFAWRLFENIVSFLERDRGLCETWFLDFPTGLESIHIEPTFVTDAFVEFILDAYQGDTGDALAEALSRRRKRVPLEPALEGQNLIGISKDRPEFIIDGGLRLVFAFNGAYNRVDRLRQAACSALRRNEFGREVLKTIPVAKILLNRHRVQQPIGQIAQTNRPKFAAIEVENCADGSQVHFYRTPLHRISLSVVSAGVAPDKSRAADIEMGLKTVAGDIPMKQVRIDLLGRYRIESVIGSEEFVVSSEGNAYSFQIIDGFVDGMIRDRGRLALDISLCSNWNYFGTYRLCLRVERRKEERR